MKNLLFILLLSVVLPCSVSASEAASGPRRIVSLSPSTTEILYAMGLGDRIVGVTNYCDYPEEAKRKPKIGGMSNPSLEAVVTLKPDIVVLTKDGNPKEFEELLHSLRIRTVVFFSRRVSELPGGIRQLGSALQAEEGAEKLAGKIERDLQRLEAASRRASGASRQKVLFIVWPEPLIVAGPGTAIDDAITLLGDRNIAASAASTYPKYSLEEAIRQAPDVIAIGKGSGMDMVEVSRGLISRMTSVPAVRYNKVCYLGDGLYRLGPRIVPGIEELAQCLERKSPR
ncbi:MAG: helical backbone metal receptor [Nitrospiraceae bacterium]|nr:helical backbone metal receptor [Nitrospiraceae bacterium]